jgi:hypothetical protein
MENDSEESISKKWKQIARSKKMKRPSTKSAPLSNENISKTSGTSSTTSRGIRRHAAQWQYMSKAKEESSWNALPRAPLSSRSLSRYKNNDTLLQKRAIFATALSFKTLGTLQAHLHPEQFLMALTWHQKAWIRPQKSYLPKLQPFVN